MRVVNTDTLSYVQKTPEKCLHEAEREKKKMYVKACLQQRWVGGDGYPEKDSHSPDHQVAAALLKDVWICQE